MGVIRSSSRCSWERNTGERRLDVALATLFLRAQASWLQRGLAHAEDDCTRRLVLAGHDQSHESWVSLVNAVSRTVGDDVADDVGSLYALHGRVAGCLARPGASGLLSPAVAAAARALVGQQLGDRTLAVTARLEAGADATGHGPRPAVSSAAHG